MVMTILGPVLDFRHFTKTESRIQNECVDNLCKCDKFAGQPPNLLVEFGSFKVAVLPIQTGQVHLWAAQWLALRPHRIPGLGHLMYFCVEFAS